MSWQQILFPRGIVAEIRIAPRSVYFKARFSPASNYVHVEVQLCDNRVRTFASKLHVMRKEAATVSELRSACTVLLVLRGFD